jgi:hypothetical protein
MTTTDEFDAPAADEPSLEDYQAAAAAVQADQAEPEVTDTSNSEPEEPAGDENPGSRREAKYRVQLRETEAERDQLRGTVEALQRAEVERIAASSIQKPSALWSADVELGTLLDDAGKVDPIKVAAAVKEATNTLGLASTRPGGHVAKEGQVVGQPAPADPWKSAFK